jgi:2-polyprenyl-3-methyl-5-hydroxy-6-metoxy-1,4-benzoquinol methylase
VAELYDAHYFEHSCGLPYRRDDHWLTFFGRIADRIVEDMAPGSVLDAGCAMGFLVEALRDRGVDAYGLDVSEYALAQAREDIVAYVRRAPITEPFGRDYDLIVCIEVLEHLSPADGETAVDNLCSHAREILFSSTPTDFNEPTHVNVQPTSHWVAQFSRRGFLPDIGYDGSYIAPWARRFHKNEEPKPRPPGSTHICGATPATSDLNVRQSTIAVRLMSAPRRIYRRFSRRPPSPRQSPGERDLAAEFERRGPWTTSFMVKGRPYGGVADFRHDRRLEHFCERFGDCKTVLELGSLEGGQTFELAARGFSMTAVEGRPENAERARWVRELLEVDGVEFIVADLENTRLRDFGAFDVVFCCGLLYHLPRPWELVDQVSDVAPAVFLWTHYADDAEAEVDGIEGHWYTEHGREDPLSGLSSESFWMTLPSLFERLDRNGFETIEVIDDDRDHSHGPAVTLAAWMQD